MKRSAVVTLLFLLVAVGTDLAAAPLQPLVVGWERFFKLEWQAGERDGKPVVYGKILNDWGDPAANIRLLAEGLDASGAVVTQRLEWLGGLTPGMRAWFEISMPQASPSYRVSVFAFDWIQADGGGDRD